MSSTDSVVATRLSVFPTATVPLPHGEKNEVTMTCTGGLATSLGRKVNRLSSVMSRLILHCFLAIPYLYAVHLRWTRALSFRERRSAPPPKRPQRVRAIQGCFRSHFLRFAPRRFWMGTHLSRLSCFSNPFEPFDHALPS